jgi:hypothetical protein
VEWVGAVHEKYLARSTNLKEHMGSGYLCPFFAFGIFLAWHSSMSIGVLYCNEDQGNVPPNGETCVQKVTM